jgi:hypothetical protein
MQIGGDVLVARRSRALERLADETVVRTACVEQRAPGLGAAAAPIARARRAGDW